MPLLVNIKWNKQTFEKIPLDPTQSVEIFKSQIYSLTGVPLDRQKLMAKGAWVGTLKDDADFSTMNLKDGQQILLMGTADVIAAPIAQVHFVEDMTDEQKAEKGTVNPAGLQNLGNTCYMNSTIECLRHMPELREAFDRVYPLGPPQNFTIALRETFNALDRSTQPLPPIEFVVLLRSLFPQFAQTSPRGGFMQQDAEEFYTILIQTLQSGLASPNNAHSGISNLITFEVEDTLTCIESSDEPPTSRRDRVTKLICNIEGGGGSSSSSSTGVNHLHEGLNLALDGTIEKRSEILGRDALWRKQQKIAQLPRYLCIQFMRFFWKATPESMDHSGVKCKIMRPVSYPEVFDIYEYCTPSLQQSLRINREKADKESEDYFNKRLKTDQTLPTVPENSMEVVGGDDSPSPTASLPPAVPSATTSGSETTEQEASLKTDTSSNDSQPDFGEGIPSSFRGHYELMGIVTHKGRSADSGHYIGWVRASPGSSVWWKYDDDTVTEVSTPDVMNLKGGGDWHTAYLNFYRLKY